jgi:receptor-interacting serine/threonine-protein kinase 5
MFLLFPGVEIPESGEITSSKDLQTCTFQIQELVLGNLNTAIAGKLLGSVNILRDSYTGKVVLLLASTVTLKRHLMIL